MIPNYYNYTNYENLVNELSSLKDLGLFESTVISNTNIIYGNLFHKTVSIVLTLENFKKFINECPLATVTFNSVDLDNLKHGDLLSASTAVIKIIENRSMYIVDLKIFTYNIKH